MKLDDPGASVIPDTDPSASQQLWDEVMSYMSSNSEVDLIAQAFSVVDINHKDFEINVLEPRGILINVRMHLREH